MPCETQDMIIVHRVFRRELAALPSLVRATPDDDITRAEIVAGHVDLLLNLLHHHHETEDDLLWPLVLDRAGDRRATVEAMNSEHNGLAELIAQVRHAVDIWRATAESPGRALLGDALDALLAPTMTHLDHEEHDALPLCAELIDQDEWNKLGERALGALGPQTALLVLAAMHEESPADEWAGFMELLPPPIQAAYAEHAAAAYRPYITALRTPEVAQ